MSSSGKLAVIAAAILVLASLPTNAHAALAVSISPTGQSAPQGTQISYAVSFSGGLLGATYDFSISGLPYGTSYSFSPTSVSAISGSSTLTIGTTDIPGAYCPGSYAFTVSVTNSGVSSDTGSASASLLVSLVGPPLIVQISTDRASYIQGDKITVQVTVNRPAEGTVTVRPPSGTPITYSFQTFYATTLTKVLTASQPYGTYTVSVSADDFCNGYNTASATYSVGPNTYDVTIALSGVPTQYSASVTVDGGAQGTVGGGEVKTLNFPISTSHTILVDQYVSGNTGTRYYCAQNTISVSSSGSFTFSYQTQYQFTVATNPSTVTQVTGGGWFPAGTTVQTGLAPPMINSTAGTQYVFKGWDINGTPQTGNPISVTLGQPFTATATYTTQYLLSVNSPYGNPQGGGYYDAGSTAQFSVTSPTGFPIQQVFVNWQGDYTGTSPQGSLTMDAPHTVTAVWSTSYIPLIAIVVVAAAIVGGLLFWRSRGAGKPAETKLAPGGTKPDDDTAVATSGVKCASCGAENSIDQKYCTNCGQQMATP